MLMINSKSALVKKRMGGSLVTGRQAAPPRDHGAWPNLELGSSYPGKTAAKPLAIQGNNEASRLIICNGNLRKRRGWSWRG
ncbi:hypothetical protein E2C01_033195 [Portunus trituberculatus]|uniref:Uncharacterized protein n=1 Tax=Portunus trituberculatus TaxID=210409 RepID=A0A5B7EX84_PORTR|nr:hypothetical protein [Portunus trituberculatus]